VFGEFQRGPGAAESSRPGLGLGLALSRGLAREMGGDLRLVRRRAHGAEFLLTIPLDPASPASPAGPAAPTPAKPAAQPTPDSRA
jgi:signal transduction histidine kinase